jgi:hypothetical protein
MRWLRSQLPPFLLIFLTSLLSYAHVLSTGYLGDDVGRVAGNPDLVSLIKALTGSLGDRPLLMFVMWFEKTFLDLGPAGLRIVGLFFHSLVAFQIFHLIQFATNGDSQNNRKFALAAAILFALHPLNSQAITIIIQHGTILASWLALLSVTFFIRGKHFLSLVMLALSVLCKPIAGFLPLFYLLITRRASVMIYVLPLAMPLIFYVYLEKNVQTFYTLGPLDYFYVQTEVVANYIRLMLVPYGMKYLYDYQVREFPVFIFVHLAILIAAYKLIRDRAPRMFFFGFYLAFIPESSIFSIIHTAFEHRTYLPMSMLFTSIGCLGAVRAKWGRNFAFGTLIISITYIGLNQLRLFQLRPATTWMLHTLENSSSHHNYNVDMNIDLLRLGFREEVAKNIEKYSKYEKFAQYVVLRSYFEYGELEKRADAIEKLSRVLVLGWDGKGPRKLGNELLIMHYDRNGATLKDWLALEYVLSMQMRIFFDSHIRDATTHIASHYQYLAHRILKESPLSIRNREQILKIKAILKHYYKEEMPGLRKEIEAAAKKEPESSIYKRLLEMTAK